MIWPLPYCCDGYAGVDRAGDECAHCGITCTQAPTRSIDAGDGNQRSPDPTTVIWPRGEFGPGRMSEPLRDRCGNRGEAGARR